MSETRDDKSDSELSRREAEATSKKTLREVEQAEKSEKTGDHDAAVPDPDSSFDRDNEADGTELM